MSLNNIPDLSLADAAPINTIHGRQRSNTSPTQPLSTNKTAPLNDASLPRPPAHAIDHYYEPPQLMRQGGRHEEQKPDLQVLTGGTHANPANPISSSPSPYSRSLKREANSPVYLDPNTISLASSNNNSYFSSRDNPNCLTRRVVQCNSDRIRSSDSDVTSISSQDENINFKQKSAEGSEDKTVNVKNRKKTSGQRNKWTQEETQALVRGCNNFAIGQWKAIRDSEPQLAKRSPGDLKDRFRTYFPDAYRKHYPNAKTHISSRVRSVDSNGNPLFGENAIRRERKQFSPEEDAALKRGYVKFGTAWSSIQKDPVLASRKATDLRDRFRNAFPQIYNSSAAAGYKPRSRKASGSNVFDFLSDANQQHGTFEAIDLSVYPPHPSRVTNHLHPNQYQLPSLDFLKAHGADAFSEFSKMLSNPHVPIGEDIGSLENPQLLATRINSAIPAHLTNTTPRPNITTPRPNDTTPRPRKALATTTAEDLEAASGGSCKQTFHSRVPVPTKPPKSLHKTQSSMDLTQFSNLHLVDTGLNLATIPHHIPADPHQIPSDAHHTQPSMYSPTHTDYLEYGASGTAQRLDNHFFQSLAAKLSLGPGGNHGDSGGNLELTESPMMGQYAHDFKAATGMNENSDWLRELEVASQTFPGAFDFSGCTTNGKMFESPEGGSSGSSLISSDPSKDSFDDRVVYTGDANHFHQSSPTCHSFTSQPALPQHQSLVHSMSTLAPQTQEFFLNGQFMENNHNLILEQLPNQEARMSMDRGPTNLHPCQLEQAGRMYQHHHHAELMNNEHLNQITLCPPLLASDLNSPLPCSPTSSASASSAIHPSSSTSSLSAISSPVTNQLDLLNM